MSSVNSELHVRHIQHSSLYKSLHHSLTMGCCISMAAKTCHF